MQLNSFSSKLFLVIKVVLLTSMVNITLSQQKEDGYIHIFDGKTFNGWEGDSTVWRIENGSLVGEVTATTKLEVNTFLVWSGGQTNDFELKLEFKITENGNGGVNYRSELVKDTLYALKGYQADIDGKNTQTGQNYEERGRGLLAKRGEKSLVEYRKKPVVYQFLGHRDALKQSIKIKDWNEYHIIATGNKLQHFINGILMSEVKDNDKFRRKLSGLLGLQVHGATPMKAQYRNLRIKQY
jgi:hypothetical protein